VDTERKSRRAKCMRPSERARARASPIDLGAEKSEQPRREMSDWGAGGEDETRETANYQDTIIAKSAEPVHQNKISHKAATN
jgi:hypothetical protein